MIPITCLQAYCAQRERDIKLNVIIIKVNTVKAKKCPEA